MGGCFWGGRRGDEGDEWAWVGMERWYEGGSKFEIDRELWHGKEGEA